MMPIVGSTSGLNLPAIPFWLEVKPEVQLGSGVLVLDDTVLDKPYACKIDPVHHIWSGKHHVVVKGIDLLTLLWIDGEPHFRAITGSMTSRMMARPRITISGT